jgi:hypothetical protein
VWVAVYLCGILLVCVRGIAVERLSEVVCLLLASFCGPRWNAITFAAVLLYCAVIEFVVYVSGVCIMFAGAFGSCETAGLHRGRVHENTRLEGVGNSLEHNLRSRRNVETQ